MAASNDSHRVTVIVRRSNMLAITERNRLLALNDIEDSRNMVDLNSYTIRWSTAPCNAVTVEVDNISPENRLRVVTEEADDGVAAPGVTLSATSRKLLTCTGKTTGECEVKYTGDTEENDDGLSVCTVIYTLMNE